jgi:hypothetical protein
MPVIQKPVSASTKQAKNVCVNHHSNHKMSEEADSLSGTRSPIDYVDDVESFSPSLFRRLSQRLSRSESVGKRRGASTSVSGAVRSLLSLVGRRASKPSVQTEFGTSWQHHANLSPSSSDDTVFRDSQHHQEMPSTNLRTSHVEELIQDLSPLGLRSASPLLEVGNQQSSPIPCASSRGAPASRRHAQAHLSLSLLSSADESRRGSSATPLMMASPSPMVVDQLSSYAVELSCPSIGRDLESNIELNRFHAADVTSVVVQSFASTEYELHVKGSAQSSSLNFLRICHLYLQESCPPQGAKG